MMQSWKNWKRRRKSWISLSSGPCACFSPQHRRCCWPCDLGIWRLSSSSRPPYYSSYFASLTPADPGTDCDSSSAFESQREP